MLYQESSSTIAHNYPTLNQIMLQSRRSDKIYYTRVGVASGLPYFLRALHFITLCNNIALYIPYVETITRSTPLNYIFNRLKTRTVPNPTEYTNANTVMFYDSKTLQDLGFEQVNSLHIYNVMSWVRDTFETYLPRWVTETGAQELLNVSLSLKLTPKHRIRVYKLNGHIIIFTTKGFTDMPEDDFLFYRKVWACLPLMCGWDLDKHNDLVKIYRSLSNYDATEYTTLLQQMLNTSDILTNFEYNRLKDSFKLVTKYQASRYDIQIQECNRIINQILQDYSTRLTELDDLRSKQFYIANNFNTLEDACVKMLIDKKIAYKLNTESLNSNNKLYYSCQAPVLGYDKSIANILYNKQLNQHTKPVQDLFKLIFIDEKAVLVFEDCIQIDFKYNSIFASQDALPSYYNLHQQFPNPHHYHYNCWGSYAAAIKKLICNYDLENLFYQVKAAVGSLNFTDGIVIGRFLNDLASLFTAYADCKCIMWRDTEDAELHTAFETLQHFIQEDYQE